MIGKKTPLDNLENDDLELVQEQLKNKRNTTIGTEFIKEKSIGGFKPLEIVESFKGQVIQGEGCEIIPEEPFLLNL